MPIRMKLLLVVASMCFLACTGPSAGDDVEVTLDVPYVAGSTNPKQKLDMYLPRGVDKYPVVLFVHGGYWTEGDRRYHSWLTGLYGRIGIALARRGIGTIVQSYRLSPETSIEGQLEDVVAAIRWTRDNISGDWPLFLAGHSAGGHLVTLLAANEKLGVGKITGVVAMSTIFDIRHMAANQPLDFNVRVTHRVFGIDPPSQKEFSPWTHLNRKMPPVLLLVGEEDYPYVIAQTKSAVRRLKKLGVKVDNMTIKGYEHSDMVLEFGNDDDPVARAISRFVRSMAE